MNAEHPLGPTSFSSSFFVFDQHRIAQDAVQRLGRSGFGREQLSLVGKGYDSEQETQGFYAQGERLKAYRGHRASWSGIWGLLTPPSVFVLPGLGLVGMAGPLVETFADALDGAADDGGLTALAAALIQMGGPPECMSKYADALKLNKYLLLVHGTPRHLGLHPGACAAGQRPPVSVWLH